MMIDKTSRLMVYKMNEDNKSSYLESAMDHDVMLHITGKALTEIEAEQKFASILEYNTKPDPYGFFTLQHADNGDFVGYLKLEEVEEKDCLEVGYALVRAYWRQGYAAEIVSEVIGHFENDRNFTRLLAFTSPSNLASKKLLELHNFRLYKSENHDGKPTDFYELHLHNDQNIS